MSITNLYEIKDGDSGQTVANGLKQNFTDVVSDLVQLEAEVNQLGGKVVGKRTALTPLFENAGAVFNDVSGFYELNGILDIGESEMKNIYNNPLVIIANTPSTIANQTARTNIKVTNPLNNKELNGFGVGCNYAFYFSQHQIIKITNDACTFTISSQTGMFSGCSNLVKIIGILVFTTTSNIGSLFPNSALLSDVKISRLKASISFQASPLLSKESILYMIQNSEATSAITITLHPTAYAMAIASAKITAALASKTFVSLASA